MRATLVCMCVGLLACSGEKHPGETGSTDTAIPESPDPAGILSRDDGWLRGDLHMHTTWSDGWEDVATVIALGEYLENPDFLAFHPEYQGNGLDFVAITDHRTVDAWSDPDYHSDRLVLVGGEEFGSPGHAGTLGISAFVDHDPDGDGTTQSDIDGAVVATHDQGAVFSPNHPFLPDIPFPWEIRDHDAIEVWNSGWNLMSPENTEKNLDAWEASHGPSSLMYRRALQVQGEGSSQQALAWYEAQLARGVHVALIGGSDRHAVLLPGFPTTWIRSPSVDPSGVAQGIRDRHTFVSRTPASAQIALEVESQGATWEAGDEIAVPSSGTDVIARVSVGRADGGIVRLIRGPAVESDEALESAGLGRIEMEEAVKGADFLLEATLSVVPGDWFYVVVLEPLYAPGLSTEQETLVWDVAVAAHETGSEDYVSLASLVGQMADTAVLADASKCDPTEWEADMMQCATPDSEGMASFFVPDMFDRALNATTIDDAPDGMAMGAVGSAVRFVAK